MLLQVLKVCTEFQGSGLKNHPDGIYIEMDLILVYGYIIKPLLAGLRKRVIEEVERLTALNIKAIDISVKKPLCLIQKNPRNRMRILTGMMPVKGRIYR